MSWAAIVHPAVDEWLASLDKNSLEQVTAAVRELREHGRPSGARSPTRSRVPGTAI